MNALVALVMSATLVFGAAIVSQPLLRRRSAAERHFVWVAAFVVVGLSWPARGALREFVRPVSLPLGSIATRWLVAPRIMDSSQSTVGVLSERVSSKNAADAMDARAMVVALWLVGAGLALARLAVGVVALSGIARRARPDQALQARCDALRQRMGVARPVQLIVAPLSVPVTWGIRSPRVALPEAATAWPAAQLDMSLQHELAHVRRHDVTWLLVGEIVRGLLWFHPFAWVALRALRFESECACDDAVLDTGARAPAYAQFILSLETAAPRSLTVSAMALVSASSNSQAARLRAILRARGPRRARPATWLAAIATAALVIATTPSVILSAAARVPAPAITGGWRYLCAEPSGRAARSYSHQTSRGVTELIERFPNLCVRARWTGRIEYSGNATVEAMSSGALLEIEQVEAGGITHSLLIRSMKNGRPVLELDDGETVTAEPEWARNAIAVVSARAAAIGRRKAVR